jgi:uncharacterized protein YjgD (DUF1641 family)
MAMPVPMKQITQADPREQLLRRIQDAPVDHADAVLSAYDLLQQLHDTGTLDVLRGALGAGDVLVEHVVSLLTAPEAVNALRNLILIGKVLASIDPEVLHAVIEGLPQAVTQTPGAKPPSLFALGRRAASQDARRGLAAAENIMEVLGRGLAKGPASSGPSDASRE